LQLISALQIGASSLLWCNKGALRRNFSKLTPLLFVINQWLKFSSVISVNLERSLLYLSFSKNRPHQNGVRQEDVARFWCVS
jgi:hypothetical protein